MSTHEHKVAAVHEFLANRASLGRVSNHEEIGNVIGKTLREKSQRRISTPVRREKVIKALAEVDDLSVSARGVMLSALVPHFWDAKAGHRFYESAVRRGLLDSFNGDRDAFLDNQQAKVFEAYADGSVPVAVLDDIEDLDEDEDSDASPSPAPNGGLTVEQVRKIFREELEAADRI